MLRLLLLLLFLLPGLLFLLTVAYLRRKIGSWRRSGQPEERGVLVRDPVCGRLLEEGLAVVKSSGGKRHHFCSAACAEKFDGR